MMLSFSPGVKIYVATTPVDFRCGIDMLAAISRSRFKLDPMDGSVFIFINRRRNSLKILNYDGQGFWLASKRMSKGTFKYFPKLPLESLVRLVAEQVIVMCRGGDPLEVKSSPDWRKIY